MKARVFDKQGSSEFLECLECLVADQFMDVCSLQFIDLDLGRNDGDPCVGQYVLRFRDLVNVAGGEPNFNGFSGHVRSFPRSSASIRVNTAPSAVDEFGSIVDVSTVTMPPRPHDDNSLS